MRITARLLPASVGSLLAYLSLFLPWQEVTSGGETRVVTFQVLLGDLGAWGTAYLLGVLTLAGAAVGSAVAPADARPRLRFVGVVGTIAALAALVVVTTRVGRFAGVDPAHTRLMRELLSTRALTLHTDPALYLGWAAVAVLGASLALRGGGVPAAAPTPPASRSRWLAATGVGVAGAGLAAASCLVPWQLADTWLFDQSGGSLAHPRAALFVADEGYWAVGYLLGLATVVAALVAVGVSRAPARSGYAVMVAVFATGLAVLAATVVVRSTFGAFSPSGDPDGGAATAPIPWSWAVESLLGGTVAFAGPYLACAAAVLLGATALLLPGRTSAALVGVRRPAFQERDRGEDAEDEAEHVREIGDRAGLRNGVPGRVRPLQHEPESEHEPRG
jgi:hypothetical protein